MEEGNSPLIVERDLHMLVVGQLEDQGLQSIDVDLGGVDDGGGAHGRVSCGLDAGVVGGKPR